MLPFSVVQCFSILPNESLDQSQIGEPLLAHIPLHFSRGAKPAVARAFVGVASPELQSFLMHLRMQFRSRGQYPKCFPSPFPGYIETPKSRFVIPTLQRSGVLREFLRSMVTQQDLACECVAQIGGSPAGSVEIAGQPATRLHASTSTPDRGQAGVITRRFIRPSCGKAGDFPAPPFARTPRMNDAIANKFSSPAIRHPARRRRSGPCAPPSPPRGGRDNALEPGRFCPPT